MERKQSLPRHTILAKTSSRFGALIVDVASLLALFIGLFYGCFNLAFSKTITNNDFALLFKYEINSHLTYFDEETQTNKIFDSDDDYTVYQNPVVYYYLSYLTGENIEYPEGQDKSSYCAPNYNEPIVLEDGSQVLPKDYYTISWYNYNILGIHDENPDDEKSISYFTYQKDGDNNFDKTKIGVPKNKRYDADKKEQVEITSTQLAHVYEKIYVSAYNHLAHQSFFLNVRNEINFYNTLSFTLSWAVAGIIVYLIVPLFFKNCETLGKKLFKIGLASFDGYQFDKRYLPLRLVPYLLTLIAMFLISYSSIYGAILVVLAIALTSFGISMGSPKKATLHDYVSRSIVVDMKASILFKNHYEEEKYVQEEDNLPPQENHGEEPPLRYEK